MAQGSRRTGRLSWRALSRAGLAVALAGCALAAAGAPAARREAALAPRLVVTEGWTTAAPSTGWTGGRRVAFAFADAEGRVWEGRDRVDARTPLPRRAGEPLAVAYPPEDPRLARVAGHGPLARALARVGMGGTLAATGAVAAWLAARRSAALRRLGRVGAAADAEVLSVARGAGVGSWWFVLRYAVTGPDGTRRVGVSRPAARAAFAGLRRGDRVAALVDPADPARFALLDDALAEGPVSPSAAASPSPSA
jgi:hypothetical protein